MHGTTTLARNGATLTLLLLAAACSSPTGSGAGGEVIQRVEIESPAGPGTEQVALQLGATVTVAGTPRAARPGEVAWSLASPVDGVISPNGEFTPSRPGTIQVRLEVVANPGLTASRQIQVDSAAIVQLSLVPLIGVAPSDTVRPQVVGVDAVGRDRVPRGVRLRSLNGTFSPLNDGESFRADAAGQGAFEATLGSLSATASVAVASPFARLSVTLLDPVVDWARGARVLVQGITATGVATNAAVGAAVNQVVETPNGLVETIVSYIPGRIRTVVPPFQGAVRRDQGATVRMAFQYRGVADTLSVPLNYRRPHSLSWARAESGPRTMQIDETFDLGETVLKDSVGAEIPSGEYFGTLSSVSSSNSIIASISPTRVVKAVTSGTSTIQQSYTEAAQPTIAGSIPITVPLPPPNLAPIGTGYIKVVAFTGLRPAERAAIVTAVARVEDVIAGSAASAQSISLPAGGCISGGPPINETITGVLIQMSVRPIDGAGGTLGAAGPCMYRPGADRRAPVGLMYFDEVDILSLVQAGRFGDVVVHEIMHVLGIGTLWYQPGYNFVSLPLGPDPIYIGTNGTLAYQFLGGLGSVPVEAGAGAHWRESVFRSEIMTPSLSTKNYLSRLTIGSLQDLGYMVNYARAETYTLGQLIAGINAGLVAPELSLGEVILQPRYMVDGFGRVVPYMP